MVLLLTAGKSPGAPPVGKARYGLRSTNPRDFRPTYAHECAFILQDTHVGSEMTLHPHIWASASRRRVTGFTSGAPIRKRFTLQYCAHNTVVSERVSRSTFPFSSYAAAKHLVDDNIFNKFSRTHFAICISHLFAGGGA